MLLIASIIGLYGFCLYTLGLLGWLYTWIVLVFTIGFFIGCYFFLRERIVLPHHTLHFSKPEKILLILLGLQILINLIGALGPEIGFDALWYHLTIPKIYLTTHVISHIPGGLLYYSDMPKLTEILYLLPLSLKWEVGAKLIHFLFGISVCIVLYQFSRKYMSQWYSLLVVLLFYSNLVVGWESITAYVDLARTFFELLSFVTLIRWMEKKEKRLFILSAVMLGLAVSTKLLSLSSLPIFLVLIVWNGLKNREQLTETAKRIFLFTAITFFIPLPWFVNSFLATGKPFYPFLTDLYQKRSEYGSLSVIKLIQDIWDLFTRSSDPLSPLYLISWPLVILQVKKAHRVYVLSFIYLIFSLGIWYFLPRVGGGRFMLPYLPVFSFLTVYTLINLENKVQYQVIYKLLVWLVVLYSVVSIGYRGVANAKFVPYLVDRETKAQFLSKHLNFSYGDFYDTDGYFAKNFKKSDKALLYGFHNLYYVDFPFIDSTWVQKGDKFNYIVVQNTALPQQYKYWNLVYSNELTGVRVYSTGGMMWVY